MRMSVSMSVNDKVFIMLIIFLILKGWLKVIFKDREKKIKLSTKVGGVKFNDEKSRYVNNEAEFDILRREMSYYCDV